MLEEIIQELKKRLKKAVKENLGEGLLFSGGLDSSILASLCPQVKAITVTLESRGEDLKYARFLSTHLKIRHYHEVISIQEAIDAIPQIIKILKSFDPAIPNDVTVYSGLKLAKRLGMETVMTGDGSDELFAGYSYMQDISELDSYIKRISASMYFSSNQLGNFFNIKIKQPYLDRELIDFSLKIPAHLKLREVKGKFTGKWILRKAFEDILPQEIIWQKKRPLEYGSGTTGLREIVASRVDEGEFEEAKGLYPVRFINKEHFYYYKIYLKEVGEIPKPLEGEGVCPGCGAGLKKGGLHCRICGWTEKY